VAHAALPYLAVLCGLAVLGFVTFNVINGGDIISLIDSDSDDEENQQLNRENQQLKRDVARAKRESLLPDSKGSSDAGLMDDFDDDDKKPASDDGDKKPAAKKETETIDLIDSDDDVEAPPAPNQLAPNQPAPKKQRRNKKDKDEKMKPSKATLLSRGKPLSEQEAKLKAQECLDKSRQDNVTSNGPRLRPGYSVNGGITQNYLPSNWSAVTNSPQSEALCKKLFRDKDLLAYNIQLQLPTFLSCDALYLSLMTMFFMGSLIVVYFLRGCGSSGINVTRFLSVIMKNPDFRILIEVLQSTFGLICQWYRCCYHSIHYRSIKLGR